MEFTNNLLLTGSHSSTDLQCISYFFFFTKHSKHWLSIIAWSKLRKYLHYFSNYKNVENVNMGYSVSCLWTARFYQTF